MKAQKLGIVSALLASVCCVGPFILVLVGMGGLGIGALLGRLHWVFIGAAIALLTVAWRGYRVERHRCQAQACEMSQRKTTKRALLAASAVVGVFIGLNLYTYAGQHHQTSAPIGAPSGQTVETKIPVEGMTCFTCELSVESALKRLPGVQNADARVVDHAAYVRYDQAQVSVDDLIEAINNTGYRATR